MTLDTVISGCVVFFLDSPEGLDPQRIALVRDCLNELEDLTAELDTDSQAYFLRLRRLGEILLTTTPQP
jgi:glycerol-3-phosphate dehydrogenase